MKYPYNISYQPPFPAVQVVLFNPEEGLSTFTIEGLIDTGSDGTLVPIAHLEEVLAPVLTVTRIRSHWGEWRSVQLFAVDPELNGLKLPNIFVVGDEQGDELILGRDVLNRVKLVLDGRTQVTEVPSQ